MIRRLLLSIAALAIAVCGVGAGSSPAAAHDARPPLSPASRILDTAAGRIEFAEAGSGAPLLSIHGAAGGYDHGLLVALRYVDAPMRVIAPSRFGYLRTPAPDDDSPAAQAEAHAALLDALNVPKAVVIGMSIGARSALELAIRHPDRVAALILIVPVTYDPEQSAAVRLGREAFVPLLLRLVQPTADLGWKLGRQAAPSWMAQFVGVPPHLLKRLPPREQAEVKSLIRSIEPLSRRYRGLTIDAGAHLSRLPLEQINVPTLVITARDDLYESLRPAEFAAREIQGAKLVVYREGGHLLVGHRDEARAEIRRFLAAAKLAPPPPPRQGAPPRR